MAKLHELKQDRATVMQNITELRNLCKKEHRNMTKDEQVKFHKIWEDKETLDTQIKLEEAAEAEQRALLEKEKPNKKFNNKQQEVEARAALNTYLRKGKSELSQEQRNILFNSKNGILVENRTQLAGTANVGAELVREEYVDIFERTLKYYGGMMEASQIITTSTGGSLPIPTSNDTSNVGAILGEGSGDSVTDIPTAEVVYSAYKYTSKAIKVSQELLQDDSYNLVGLIPEICGERIGRITNTHFTTGDGSSKPQGVTVGATASGFTITANTWTRAKVLDLIYSVDKAYRMAPGACLMFSSAVEKQLVALAIGTSDDRPLWVPSMRDGTPATIEGYKYVVNEDVPDAGTSANVCMLFGDFSKYVIRKVRDFTIRRTDDRHIEEFVAGFYGFARMDGKILNSTAIKSIAVA